METARTRIRRFNEGDLANMRMLETDAEIMKRTPMRVPLTEEVSRERLAKRLALQSELEPLGFWAVELKSPGNLNPFVGWFMITKRDDPNPELGFMIVRDKWNRGFTTEISEALIAHAFALGEEQLVAYTDTDHVVSQRVLKKLGFEMKGEISKPIGETGETKPLSYFALTRDQFRKRNS